MSYPLSRPPCGAPPVWTLKRIGLLGGMSWESSAEYYRLVNQATRDRLGGLHSANCLLRSVDFADIEVLQRTGRWEAAGAQLAEEAASLVDAGAELVVLCTDTMHKVAAAIVDTIDLPFLHIADTTAEQSARTDSRRSVSWPPTTPWSRTSTSAGFATHTDSR